MLVPTSDPSSLANDSRTTAPSQTISTTFVPAPPSHVQRHRPTQKSKSLCGSSMTAVTAAARTGFAIPQSGYSRDGQAGQHRGAPADDEDGDDVEGDPMIERAWSEARRLGSWPPPPPPHA